MFDRKPTIQQLIHNLYCYASTLSRGEIITHESIIDILGVQPHEAHWDHCVNMVRRRLQTENGIATWPDRGVGYKLCTFDEQNNLGTVRLSRGRRQIRKGVKSVQALPVNELNTHQQICRAMQIDKLKRMDRGITAEIRTSSVLLAPQEAHPRIR